MGAMSERAANTFRGDEIEALNQVFATLRRGGDVRAIMKTEAFRSVERKFRSMGRRATPFDKDKKARPLHVTGNVIEAVFGKKTVMEPVGEDE
jgi:hypothetical protein